MSTSDGARIVIPGDALYSSREGYECGRGVYELRGFIRAARVGHVFLTEKVNAANSKTTKVVEVLNPDGSFNYQVPYVGAVVTARIVEISDRKFRDAKCIIKRIDETILQEGATFSAIITKQNMRDDVKLDAFKVRECVLPGDYVLASVISTGDSHYMLSIIDSRLGVVAVKCPCKNQWIEPKSHEAKLLGPRKVALIPSTLPKLSTLSINN